MGHKLLLQISKMFENILMIVVSFYKPLLDHQLGHDKLITSFTMQQVENLADSEK